MQRSSGDLSGRRGASVRCGVKPGDDEAKAPPYPTRLMATSRLGVLRLTVRPAPGLDRRMTMAVARIQPNITIRVAHAGHQWTRPADQNSATPITASPVASRMQ
jgi:hypothetical protein